MTILFLLSLIFHTPPYKTLQWSDFQGSYLNESPNILARTSWSIQLNTYYNEGRAAYIVSPEFIPEESFTRTNDPEVLAHENIHWFLCLIFARKIESEIQPYQGALEDNDKKVDRIYNRLCNSLRKIQETYDRETQHSNCKAQQKKWNDLINKQLNHE